MNENQIGTCIVTTAIQIHKELGPGLFESVYEIVLARELQLQGLQVDRQVPVRIHYKDLTFDDGFRADIIVNSLVIIELKSLEAIHPVHKKQLLTYLKLTNLRVGYLLNFGEELMRTGITRIINGTV